MWVTEKNIKQFAVFYVACFALIYSYFIYHGLLFSLIDPVFFLNRLDLTHNIFMLTNLQHCLLRSEWLRIGFDAIYLLLPLALLYACLNAKKIQTLLAIATVVFNILYNSFFSTLSVISVENLGAWMFLPLVFLARTPKGFYYALHVCRLLFILIFFSTGLWKIRAGGVFNTEQMSAILFYQHGLYLALGSHDAYSKFITYLINHPLLSYSLYLFATVAEVSFCVGFFTKKFDKYLLVLFCTFVVFDYLIMGINYFTWLPFMGCLYFSKYQLRDS